MFKQKTAPTKLASIRSKKNTISKVVIFTRAKPNTASTKLVSTRHKDKRVNIPTKELRTL